MNGFSEPEKNIKQFRIDEGDVVADLGAGSGFYSLAIARLVGERGKVYAVEVQKELMKRVKDHAQQERLHNVEVIWGDIEEVEGTKIRTDGVDIVLLSNILFQVEDKPGLINESKRILKPGGRVLIIDWTDSHGGVGPEQSAVITAADARSMFEQQGFVYEGDIEAGSHHYGFSMNMA